jgi:ABC-type multidrug transport system fused ATPase/permease subunit
VTNVVVGLLLVGLGLAGVETLRRLTDIATGAREGDILAMAGLFASILVMELLLHIASTWVAAVLGVKTQNLMQQKFFARLLNGKWSGVERFHSGDVLNRLFGDVGDIVRLMTEVLPSAVVVVVQFVASFVYLYTMDSSLALILIVVSPIFLVLSRLYFMKMRRIVRKIKDSNSALQSIIQESVQHKMVIKVLERSGLMVDKLESRQKVLRGQVKSRARFSIFSKTLIKHVTTKEVFFANRTVLSDWCILIIACCVRNISHRTVRTSREGRAIVGTTHISKVGTTREHIEANVSIQFQSLSESLRSLLGRTIVEWLTPVNGSACPELTDKDGVFGVKLFCSIVCTL